MHALSSLLIGLLLAALLGSPAWAVDYLAGPENYRSHLSRLRAGDHLLLRAGDYERGLPLHHLAGEPGRPIVIEGEIVPPARPDGTNRPPGGPSRSWGGPATDLIGTRFLARPGTATVSLLDVSHLVIRNLELDGRNLPVDAVKAEGHSRYAHYITLENLYIHDHAASQQNVGISSKCPAFGWVVRGNRIERVGTGLYFGDSDGSDPFVAGLIEGNRVSDTIGYNLQIKHQMSRPADLPESDRDHDTVIRHNVFAKETAWPDRAARPNVLVGHAPIDGPGSRDRVLVYGNLFWQNPSEALFQGEGHLAIYNNVFVNSQGHALHIQPHNDLPRQVDIFHNTVLARGHGIRVLQREGMPPAGPQRVLRNLVFAAQPIVGGEAGDNLIGGVDSAARFLKKPYAELGQLDFTPRMTLAGEVWPDRLRLDAYPDSGQDIDRRARMAPVLGACIAEAEMPCPKR